MSIKGVLQVILSTDGRASFATFLHSRQNIRALGTLRFEAGDNLRRSSFEFDEQTSLNSIRIDGKVPYYNWWDGVLISPSNNQCQRGLKLSLQVIACPLLMPVA